MIIISDYELVENPLLEEFFVRSAEQNFCPCCGGPLKVIGSRKRKYLNDAGEGTVLVIRRLKCEQCRRIHHELPDILVPYKRYASECIESVISEDKVITVAADESTIRRWKAWFKGVAPYWAGCLNSLSVLYGSESVVDPSNLPKSALQRILHYVGYACLWLARVVRTLTNKNLWVHTRSAFLS